LRRVRPAGGLGAAVQRLRAGAGRQRRDPPLHGARARRRGARDSRRRRADPRLVLRRRRRRGAAGDPRARRGGRAGLQRRQPALGRDRVRPGRANLPPRRLGIGDRLPAAPLHGCRDADPERRQGAQAARLGAADRPRRGPRAHDRLVPGAPSRPESRSQRVRLVFIAAALAVALVPGASAQPPNGRFSFFGPAVISPNGNGINDVLRVRTSEPSVIHVYRWGGRLHGWHGIAAGSVDWAALHDGSYQVASCSKDPGRKLAPVIPTREQRPGVAEATVSRPPWRWSGCTNPRVVRVERLAAYVDSAKSYTPGSRPPLVVSADRGQATTKLVENCSGRAHPGSVLPGLASGLYHYDVTDPAGDRFRAPVVVRNATFPLDHPPPHTALLVWPYLTWRAYNAYDADLNGIPDSWYQFWRQRRVSLVGTILPGGQEDDYQAAQPFSTWLCSRKPRVESITDVELRHVPLSTLRRYAAIVFPGHSEYYEPATYDLLMR